MDLFSRFKVVDGDKLLTLFGRLNDVGTKAFKGIESGAKAARPALLQLDAAVKQIKAGFDDTLEGGKKVGEGMNQTGEAFDRVGKGMEKTAKRVEHAVLLITGAAAAAATAAAAWANSTSDAVVEADKQGAALGLSARQFQIWDKVVTNAGGSTDDFTAAVSNMNDLVAAAIQGNEDAQATFAQYGISITNANGRLKTTQQLLGEIHTLFDKSNIAEQARLQARGYQDATDTIASASERAKIAMDFFGDAGAKLVPALNVSAAAINTQARFIDRTGQAFSKADVIIGKEFKASLQVASGVVDGLKDRLGVLLAEKGIPLLDKFSTTVARNKDAIIDWASKAIDWVNLFIDDVVAVFTGKKASAANDWINQLHDGFLAFAAGVADTWSTIIKPTLEALYALFGKLATFINDVFGTNLSAGQVAFITFLSSQLRLFGLIAPLVTVISGGLQLIYGFTTSLLGVIRLLLPAAIAVLAPLAAIVGWPALVVAGVVILGATLAIFWDDVVAGVKTALGWLSKFVDGISNAWAAAKAFFASPQASPPPAASPAPESGVLVGPGFKEGGLIQGPGTGTSDSILARVGSGLRNLIRVSAGEGVLNARAVRNIGVAGLNAINAGFIPRFAEGGLIGAMQPALAGVEGVGDGFGQALHLHLADGTVVQARTNANGRAALTSSDQFSLTRNPMRWMKR